MEPHTVFDSAIDDWYRQNVQATIDILKTQSSPKITFTFRPNQVVDGSRAGGHQIEASDEHIARWDIRPPTKIFKDGFAPKTPRDWTTPHMYNFSRYQVESAVNSVFVATARCFQNDEGVPDMWKPLDWDKKPIFKYAISGCYGGIDVNATLGEKNFHFKEREITFVGGIKRNFVRFAIQYEDGVATKIWENGHTTQVASTIPRPAGVPVVAISPE